MFKREYFAGTIAWTNNQCDKAFTFRNLESLRYIDKYEFKLSTICCRLRNGFYLLAVFSQFYLGIILGSQYAQLLVENPPNYHEGACGYVSVAMQFDFEFVVIGFSTDLFKPNESTEVSVTAEIARLFKSFT